MTTGSEYAAGAGADLIPIAFAGVGLTLILRPFISSPGAVNAGAVLLGCGVLLAFAAETAGIGPDTPARTDAYFDPAFIRAHGGAIGEALYWCSTTLFQRLGATIIAVLLIVSGVVLATGGTIAGALRGTGRAATRAARGTRELTQAVRAARPAPQTPGFPTAPTHPMPADTFETDPIQSRGDAFPEPFPHFDAADE